MFETPRHRPFPHEIGFLLAWSGQIVALLVTHAFRTVDLLPLAVSLFLLALMKKGVTGFWYQARLWFPLAAFDASYLWMADAVPRLRPWRGDASLLALDHFAFGDCLSAKVAPMISGGFHEVLSFAYLLFFPLFTIGFVVAARCGGRLRTAILCGFYTIYTAGLIGYTLVPAAGPFRYPAIKESLPVLANGGPISRFNDSIVLNGCNGVDVFPSLHTAVTLFLLLSAFSASRRLFAILLIPCGLIITATIGLQYHYAADVLAGAVIGIAAWWFTVRRYYTPPSNSSL